MKIGNKGLDLIKKFEGLRLKAYLCPAGVWTIGYGHTRTAMEGMIISEEWAEQLLKEDCADAEKAVKRLVKVPLSQNQFDALVSWTFNLGSGNLQASTLLKKLNQSKYNEVPFQIKRWNKAGGKVLAGLVKRREAEANLWSE